MTLPTGNTTQLSMGQIADEFGDTRANGEISLGDYKKVALSGNYPQRVGELSFSSIDGGGQVPVDTTPNNKSVEIYYKGKKYSKKEKKDSSKENIKEEENLELKIEKHYKNNNLVYIKA